MPSSDIRFSVFADLTDKQRETVYLLAEGLTGKEIAARLNISHSAVSQRIENLRSKFGGITKNELARTARDWLTAQTQFHGSQAPPPARKAEDNAELGAPAVSAEAVDETCTKNTGQKNHLPNSTCSAHQGDRSRLATELRFSDSFAVDATPPWKSKEDGRLVPEVLDGEHAALARWAYVVGVAIGMVVLLLVLLAVADALGDLA